MQGLNGRSADASDVQVLLRATARADEQAFAALYDATVSDAYAVAYAGTRCPEAAGEVIRNGYLEVWHRAAQYQEGWLSARSWVLSVVHTAATRYAV